MAEKTYVDATGTIVTGNESGEPIEPEPTYTNQIPLSVDANGAVYNGTGWAADKRVSSSGVEQDNTGTQLTGFIPFSVTSSKGDILYGSAGIFNASALNYERICVYDSSKKFLKVYHANSQTHIQTAADGSFVFNPLYYDTTAVGCAFARVVCTGLDENAVITKNEPIE